MSAATPVPVPAAKSRAPAVEPSSARPVLRPWLSAQALNVTRHAAALRPFSSGEFGPGPAAPSEGHVQAANNLIRGLRRGLIKLAGSVREASAGAAAAPGEAMFEHLLNEKDRSHGWVQAIERVWDFYFELFGQRQSRYGQWLLGCDRIALDCYQDVYMGLGTAKSIPAPPPFCYMRTGFSPATFRRGVRLSKLGKRINPFPLIQLPYHRLVNPWTLGAVLHEVSHNLQNELGLAGPIPRAIGQKLLNAGLGQFVASVWLRWHREIFADLSAMLLGGPAVIASLMDVVGRSPEATLAYSPKGVHPTPYLRTLISIDLLRRMGFPETAGIYRRAWTRLYPNPRAGDLPAALLKTHPEAQALVVEAICFEKYPELGGKSLIEVIRFAPKEQQMIEEAAGRMAAGTDPGIIPERYLIGATRLALDRRLARPGAIAQNFYRELARR